MISAMSSLSELCQNRTYDQDSNEEEEEYVCAAQEALLTCFTRLAFEGTAHAESGAKVVVETEKRLMLVMSNCLYTRTTVARSIARKFETLRLGSLGNMYDDCMIRLEV